MKLQKNNSQKNLIQVREFITTIEKKLSSFENDKSIVENLDSDELADFHKILTNCEIVLSKYESKKTEYLKADLKKSELQEIQDLAWHAFSSIGGKDWGRVDFIQDEQGYFQIIEVNLVPGLTEASLYPKAASLEGISFVDLVCEILLLACKGP